jgi:hypothetical protein
MKIISISLCFMMFIFSSNVYAGPASTLIKSIFKTKSAVKVLPAVPDKATIVGVKAGSNYLHRCNTNEDKNSKLCLIEKGTPKIDKTNPNSFMVNSHEGITQQPVSNIFTNIPDKDNITDKNILDLSKIVQ